MTQPNDIEHTVGRIVAAVADLPGIAAIALGGSTAAGLADAASDLDVYVYWREPLAEPEQRATRLRPLADDGSLHMNLLTWGLEDHLRVQTKLVELVYFNLDLMSADAGRAYGEGLMSNAYTTALLYTIASGRIFHDPTGELGALRERLLHSYPEPTRYKLLRHHPELLWFSLKLLRRAQQRNDLLFVQQMRYEVQATFFDLLFALNRQYHPGGKRLLMHAARCPLLPADFAARWSRVARLAADDTALADVLSELVDDLCNLIEEA